MFENLLKVFSLAATALSFTVFSLQLRGGKEHEALKYIILFYWNGKQLDGMLKCVVWHIIKGDALTYSVQQTDQSSF